MNTPGTTWKQRIENRVARAHAELDIYRQPKNYSGPALGDPDYLGARRLTCKQHARTVPYDFNSR